MYECEHCGKVHGEYGSVEETKIIFQNHALPIDCINIAYRTGLVMYLNGIAERMFPAVRTFADLGGVGTPAPPLKRARSISRWVACETCGDPFPNITSLNITICQSCRDKTESTTTSR